MLGRIGIYYPLFEVFDSLGAEKAPYKTVSLNVCPPSAAASVSAGAAGHPAGAGLAAPGVAG